MAQVDMELTITTTLPPSFTLTYKLTSIARESENPHQRNFEKSAEFSFFMFTIFRIVS